MEIYSRCCIADKETRNEIINYFFVIYPNNYDINNWFNKNREIHDMKAYYNSIYFKCYKLVMMNVSLKKLIWVYILPGRQGIIRQSSQLLIEFLYYEGIRLIVMTLTLRHIRKENCIFVNKNVFLLILHKEQLPLSSSLITIWNC